MRALGAGTPVDAWWPSFRRCARWCRWEAMSVMCEATVQGHVVIFYPKLPWPFAAGFSPPCLPPTSPMCCRRSTARAAPSSSSWMAAFGTTASAAWTRAARLRPSELGLWVGATTPRADPTALGRAEPPTPPSRRRYVWIGGTGGDSESGARAGAAGAPAHALALGAHASSPHAPPPPRDPGMHHRPSTAPRAPHTRCQGCQRTHHRRLPPPPARSALQDPRADQGAHQARGAAHVELRRLLHRPGATGNQHPSAASRAPQGRTHAEPPSTHNPAPPASRPPAGPTATTRRCTWCRAPSTRTPSAAATTSWSCVTRTSRRACCPTAPSPRSSPSPPTPAPRAPRCAHLAGPRPAGWPATHASFCPEPACLRPRTHTIPCAHLTSLQRPSHTLPAACPPAPSYR